MPIMAVQEQNDARGAARVLARTIKKCVDDARDPARHKTSFRNMYHLLESYRSHRFIPLEYQPRSERGPESLNILPSADQHVGDLRIALESALDQIYDDREKGIVSLEQVMRSMAYPDKLPAPQLEDKERTSEFLSTFIDRLYAAG
ncbi:hypothetical protein GCM10009087_48150 [Sphingomonas oligophenolica]|uniref:Uncharacterized protein n=1 Tax=Sphingomonas oligophenolica TaxID=301154 RepID=A0ABU9YCZ3_9SPHN